MCRQFRFDNKSQFRVFLAKPQKAADLKLYFDEHVGYRLGLDELGVHALEDIGQVVIVGEGEGLVPVVAVEPEVNVEAIPDCGAGDGVFYNHYRSLHKKGAMHRVHQILLQYMHIIYVYPTPSQARSGFRARILGGLIFGLTGFEPPTICLLYTL